MKKKILLFFIFLGMLTYGQGKDYKILKVEGDEITIQKIKTEEIKKIKIKEAEELGIKVPKNSNLGRSFKNAFMPKKNNQALLEGDSEAISSLEGNLNTGDNLLDGTINPIGDTPISADAPIEEAFDVPIEDFDVEIDFPAPPPPPPIDVVADTVTSAYGAK